MATKTTTATEDKSAPPTETVDETVEKPSTAPGVPTKEEIVASQEELKGRRFTAGGALAPTEARLEEGRAAGLTERETMFTERRAERLRAPAVQTADRFGREVAKGQAEIDRLRMERSERARREREEGAKFIPAGAPGSAQAQRAVQFPAAEDGEFGLMQFDVGQAGSAIDAELDQTNAVFDQMQANADDILTRTLADIASTFDRRRREQKEVNNAALASQTQAGIRAGRQRFAPEVEQGILTATESAGLQRVADLDALETSLTNDAINAAANKSMGLMLERLNAAKAARKDKEEAVRELRSMAIQEEGIQQARRREAREEVQFQQEQQQLERDVALENFALVAPSLLSFDETGAAILPSDDEIQQIADQLGVDPLIVKSQLTQQQRQLEEFARTASREDLEFELNILKKQADLENVGLTEEIRNFNFAKENGFEGGPLEFLTQKKKITAAAGADVSALSGLDKLKARNLSVQVFGKRAGTKPENLALVEGLVAEGMTVDDIQDALNFSNQSSLFTGEIRDAGESLALGMSAEKGQRFLDSLDRSLETGDMTRVKDELERQAVANLPAAEATGIAGKLRTVELLGEIEADLQRYEEMGGDTGILTGTAEQVANKIGKTTDPALAQIANKVNIAIQNYRKAISGAAFNELESIEYSAIFPSIDKTSELNVAKLQSLNEVFQGDVDNVMKRQMGSQAYDKIFGRDITKKTALIDSSFNTLVEGLSDDDFTLVEERLLEAEQAGEDLETLKADMLEFFTGQSPGFNFVDSDTEPAVTGVNQKQVKDLVARAKSQFNRAKEFTKGKTKYLSLFGPITGFGSPLWKPGLDVDVQKGDLIPSPVDGEVIASANNGGFGNQVKIRLKDGNEIWISHLDNLGVELGQKIKKGQLIGLGGNTGNVIPLGGGDGSHLDITMKNAAGQLFTAREVQEFLNSIS